MDYAKEINKDIQRLKQKGQLRPKDISDGYHTIGDLYDHRLALTVALCHSIKWVNEMYVMNDMVDSDDAYCYKSKLHSDGTMFDGMFIVVIETEDGQISYHYNLEHWDKFKIEEKEMANEYDGHTPEMCIERLLKL